MNEAESAPKSGLLRNSAFAGAGSMIALVAVFGEAVVALQVLDAEAYGTFVLATVVVMFLVTVSDIGMMTSVTHRVASVREADRPGYVTAALATRISTMAVLSLLVIPARGAIGAVVDGDFENTTLLVLLMFWATGLEEILIASLRGHERHQSVARLQVTRASIRFTISVSLLLAGWGPEALAVSWFFAFSISAIGAFMALPNRTMRFESAKARDLLVYGRGAVYPRLITFAVTFVPVAMLGRYSSNAAVAIFSAAQRLPAGLRTLSDALTTVFFPRMAALVSEKKRSEAQDLMTGSMMTAISLLGLSAVVISFIGSDILGLVFGSTYSVAGGTFTLLLLALAFTMPNWLMGFSLSASGRPGVPALITLGEAVILLPVEFFLIDRVEYAAPAVAMLVAAIGGFPVGVLLLRTVGLGFPWLRYLGQVLILGGATLIGSLAARSIDGPALIGLGLLTTAVYVVISFRISYVPLSGAMTVRQIWGRFRPPRAAQPQA